MARPPLIRAIVSAAVLLMMAGCGSTPTTTTKGSTSTLRTSPASTSIVQSVQPESATSAADSEPVDIPVTPGGDPVLVNTPAAGPAATLVISGDAFDQRSVSIPVGGVVMFRAGDDATHGIVVESMHSVTLTGGLLEYYQFPLSGTFEVTDELSAATATIVVN